MGDSGGNVGNSGRTGWAENSMRGWMKMEAQIVAVRIQMPAWAIIAVPGVGGLSQSRWLCGGNGGKMDG